MKNIKIEVKPTHRYVCDACTGIAKLSEKPEEFKSVTCKVCGKNQVCKKTNWIKL